MGWLKTVVAEGWGLFVDDGRYALAIIVWLALAWFVLPHLGLAGGWNAAILCVGLLLILLEGSLRGAHKR